MAILSNIRSVETEGLNNTEAFKIEASAKMFSILSDKLYSNKIAAIIRELSTNAVDAHIAAGHEEEFDVKLPSHVEPSFIIRDYGIGLSEEDVMSLYSTYGSSTKTFSNAFVGALGLGSKAPFCYTDSFTVESFFGGFRKVYMAFLNEENIPNITKVHEEPSEERNGLKIIVPCKASDANAFLRDATSIYFWFKDIKPRFSDPSLVNFAPETFWKNGWTFSHPTRNSKIVMGCVSYSFNCRDFDKGHLEGIAIEAPIGSIQFTPSREQLSLDPASKQYLQDLLNKIENKIFEDTRAQLAAIEDVFEVQKFMFNLPYYIRSTKGKTLLGEWLAASDKEHLKVDSIHLNFIPYELKEVDPSDVAKFQVHELHKINERFFIEINKPYVERYFTCGSSTAKHPFRNNESWKVTEGIHFLLTSQVKSRFIGSAQRFSENHNKECLCLNVSDVEEFKKRLLKAGFHPSQILSWDEIVSKDTYKPIRVVNHDIKIHWMAHNTTDELPDNSKDLDLPEYIYINYSKKDGGRVDQRMIETTPHQFYKSFRYWDLKTLETKLNVRFIFITSSQIKKAQALNFRMRPMEDFIQHYVQVYQSPSLKEYLNNLILKDDVVRGSVESCIAYLHEQDYEILDERIKEYIEESSKEVSEDMVHAKILRMFFTPEERKITKDLSCILWDCYDTLAELIMTVDNKKKSTGTFGGISERYAQTADRLIHKSLHELVRDGIIKPNESF